MFVLYADFGYPCCYLAGRAVDALSSTGVEVDWRAVEHEPRLSKSPRPMADDDRALLTDEPAVWELLAPGEDPAAAPRTVPNTAAAVAGYAEAYGAGVADDARRLLLKAYWVDHANIGDPEVLRRLLAGPLLRGRSGCDAIQRFGFAVSANREPVTTGAWRRIRAWREEWEQLGTRALPTLVGEGGTVAGAADVVGRLAKLVQESGQLDPPNLPDPARFPQVRVRPGKQWVSMVGGRWAHAWMGR